MKNSVESAIVNVFQQNNEISTKYSLSTISGREKKREKKPCQIEEVGNVFHSMSNHENT